MAAHDPDAFCFQCGTPQPWASRKQRILGFQNLLEFEELDEPTQLAMVEEIAVLTAPLEEKDDNERTQAGARIRSLAPKLWETGLPILQTLITAGAKKQLGLPDV